MRDLGPRNQFRGANLLVRFTTAQRHEAFGVGSIEPKRLPQLPDGHAVICSIVSDHSDNLVLCKTVEDMRDCQSLVSVPHISGVRWYTLDTNSVPVE